MSDFLDVRDLDGKILSSGNASPPVCRPCGESAIGSARPPMPTSSTAG